MGLEFVGLRALVGPGVGSNAVTGPAAIVGTAVGNIITGGHCDCFQHCLEHNTQAGVDRSLDILMHNFDSK